MPSEQKHVWVVRRDRGSLALPIRDEEAAAVYKEAGWQVTELPRAAFENDELLCLGIGRSERSA